jgi:hypothetical protein
MVPLHRSNPQNTQVRVLIPVAVFDRWLTETANGRGPVHSIGRRTLDPAVAGRTHVAMSPVASRRAGASALLSGLVGHHRPFAWREGIKVFIAVENGTDRESVAVIVEVPPHGTDKSGSPTPDAMPERASPSFSAILSRRAQATMNVLCSWKLRRLYLAAKTKPQITPLGAQPSGCLDASQTPTPKASWAIPARGATTRTRL